MRGRRIALLLSCWTGFAGIASAAPDLANRRVVETTIVFPDDRRTDLFYYAPLELRLITAADGRPEFSFIDMRYTGSGQSLDRGLVLHRSLLTIRVELPARTADQLTACARALAGSGRPPELRPLPLRRIEAALVYTTIGAEDSTTGVLPGGRIHGSRAAEGPLDDGYWNERVFTVGLDSLTSQMLRSTLTRGQLSLSLGYAFVAEGRLAAEPWGGIDGPPSVSDALRRELAAGDSSAARDSALRRVVAAGALPIRVDVSRWPDLLRRLDVDDASGFGALDLYCYDFRDNRRPDLYERQVEVEAEAVGGRPVRLHAAFARAHPDVYRVSLRFPVAVKLDRPYRYRVTDVRSDGSSKQGSWSSGRDWVGLLDLTTPAFPTARGVRPIR